MNAMKKVRKLFDPLFIRKLISSWRRTVGKGDWFLNPSDSTQTMLELPEIIAAIYSVAIVVLR